MCRPFRQAGLKTVALGIVCLLRSGQLFGQETSNPIPVSEASDDGNARRPSVPQPSRPPVVAVSVSREAQLEARVQQLEAMVKQLSAQMNSTRAGYSTAAAVGTDESGPGGAGPVGSTGGPPDGMAADPSVAAGAGGTGGQTGGPATGPGVPGQSFPPVPRLQARFDTPATLPDNPGKVRFGPGFEIASNDDEFVLQFHDLTQFDYRGYLKGNQNPVHDSFGIPRQWWMFNGHMTREIGFIVSFAQGFSSLNGLDIFVDFNYDKRLQVRAGRFKTPFTYEFFVEPVQGLITPERSLFLNNFGQNRDEGIMGYGQLFDAPNGVSRVQYAAGIFNGNRNGFAAGQDSKFISAFLNLHPFGGREGSAFENFNIGGSVFAGDNAQPAIPATYRTVQAITGDATFGVPFLTLGNQTGQYGPTAFWDLHTSYFYQQLAVIAEWQSGYQDYALNTNQATRSMHTHVPVQSYYVQAGYMLTGETRSQIGIVKPLNPFSLRPGRFGLGAWELFGRYNYLDIGNQIFTHGIASADGDANRLFMTDAGLTWHMTQYVKMFFDWNHVEFNNPVIYNNTNNVSKNARQSTSNTLWWRLQLFF